MNARLRNSLLAISLIFSVAVGAKESQGDKSCADLLKGKSELNKNWVAQTLEKREKSLNPAEKRVRSVAQRQGVGNVSYNEEILRNHTNNYSHSLPEGAVCDQKATGRCWIFSGISMMRSQLLAEGKVSPDFELSANYLYFYSMLERANRYIWDASENLAKGLKGEEFYKKSSPNGIYVTDGGMFEWFQFLVKKYGLVSKEAMPDTINSGNTGQLNADLQTKLVSVGKRLESAFRGYKKEDGISSEREARLEQIREEALEEVLAILQTHLGTPPTKFEAKVPDQRKASLINAMIASQQYASSAEAQQQLIVAAKGGDPKAGQILNAMNILIVLEKSDQYEKIKQQAVQGDKSATSIIQAADYIRADWAQVRDIRANGVSYMPTSIQVMDPMKFAVSLGIEVEDYITITADVHKKNALYFHPDSSLNPGKEVKGLNITSLNVDEKRMQLLVADSIKRGQAVYFAADIGKDMIAMKGAMEIGIPGQAVLHPNIFDKDAVYGFSNQKSSMVLNRETKRNFGHTRPVHAMLFVGVDIDAATGDIIKFKVENSWGKNYGFKGYVHMYTPWFTDNVFSIVVHKSILSAEELELLKKAPISEEKKKKKKDDDKDN